MALAVTFWARFATNYGRRPLFQVRARGSGGNDLRVTSSDLGTVNGAAISSERKEKLDQAASVNGGNDFKFGSRDLMEAGDEDLEPLWDDGYGSRTVKDYMEAVDEMIKPDGGPPRWFCPVECGRPLRDSPLLLFLPGMDGVGFGLVLHHKALGKVFEVRCLHIPVNDRTPFGEMVKFVGETIRHEAAMRPNKPIYIVGDSFGGCLALAVAAHNPSIDLVLILANSATSFGNSQLQPLFPFLEAVPDALQDTLPYLLSSVMGQPVKMAMVNIGSRLPPTKMAELLSNNLTDMLPLLSVFSKMLPKETLVWKLRLLKSAAAYANSRLHAVEAEVLVLASAKDNMLPSVKESQRLKSSLRNCTIRHFKENGHTLLLEDGLSLLTIIKGTGKYRRSRRIDFVSDFLPPSMSEYRYGFDQVVGLFRLATSSIMLSTMEDGKIVKGLSGVPNDGPVLLVGYHMLLGFELSSLIEEFLREKKILVRGLAHPALFLERLQGSSPDFSISDWVKVMGGLPVTPNNLYKLLSTKSHVLLYPGGQREALHNKGEEYKLFWPNQQEFVRMAARFGATIVPFGTVGEDDLTELVLDYHDWVRIPFVSDFIRQARQDEIKIRDEAQGEVASPEVFVPGMLPKVPGRFYYLFGKPIRLQGRKDLLEDKEKATEVYLQVKREIEQNIAYLLKKREEDPYRNIVDRLMYAARYATPTEVPSFDP